MKIQVTSTFSNAKRVKRVIEEARGRGFEVLFDWTIDVQKYSGREGRLAKSQAILDAIKRADVLVAITPLGTSSLMELGVALACEKKIVVLGQSLDSFHIDHPNVIRITRQPGMSDLVNLAPLWDLLEKGSILSDDQIRPA
jgi:hypothetical protein